MTCRPEVFSSAISARTRRLAQIPKCGLFAVVMMAALASSAHAAEHIILRNGSDFFCDHRETVGDKVRLYTDAAGSSFLEVDVSDIVSDEQVSLPRAASAAEFTGKYSANSTTPEHITLRNGFDLVCAHREIVGDKVRLYTDAAGSSFLEVDVSDIVGIEQVSLPRATPTVSSFPTAAPRYADVQPPSSDYYRSSPVYVPSASAQAISPRDWIDVGQLAVGVVQLGLDVLKLLREAPVPIE